MTGQEAVELIRQEAWTGRKPGLSRTRELLKRVGNRRLRWGASRRPFTDIRAVI